MNSKIINFIPDAAIIGSIFLAIALDLYFPIVEFSSPMSILAGWLLLIIAIYFAWRSLSLIKSHNQNTYVATRPPQLLTKGMYAHSRNPFYLYCLFITISVTLILGSAVSLIAPILYLLIINYYVIPIEEQNLRDEFGNEFTKYQSSVRRWL